MAKSGFKVFDSDMHIMEPPDLWERYIDMRFKSRAPRGVTSGNVRDLRMIYPKKRLTNLWLSHWVITSLC